MTSKQRAIWYRANVVEVPDVPEMIDHPGDTVSRVVAISDGFRMGSARWHYPTKSWCHKGKYDGNVLFWSLVPSWESTSDETSDVQHLMAALVQQEGVLTECETLLREALDEHGVNIGFDERLQTYWTKSNGLSNWRSRDLRLAEQSRETTGESAEPMLLAEAIELLKGAGSPASSDWKERYRRLIDLYDHIKSLPEEPAGDVIKDVARRAAELMPTHSHGGDGPTLEINLRPEKASGRVRHLVSCNLNYIDSIGEGCDCGAENGDGVI